MQGCADGQFCSYNPSVVAGSIRLKAHLLRPTPQNLVLSERNCEKQTSEQLNAHEMNYLIGPH